MQNIVQNKRIRRGEKKKYEEILKMYATNLCRSRHSFFTTSVAPGM